jgi:hypothetical protein
MNLTGSDTLVKEAVSFGCCTAVRIAACFSQRVSAWSFFCQLIVISDFDDAEEQLTQARWSVRRFVAERRIDKRVTIALHEYDKPSGEAQLGSKTTPSLANGMAG